jgi:hypothetical protein
MSGLFSRSEARKPSHSSPRAPDAEEETADSDMMVRVFLGASLPAVSEKAVKHS